MDGRCKTCKWWLRVREVTNYGICGKIERLDEADPSEPSPLAFISPNPDPRPSPPAQSLYTLPDYGCVQYEPREND